MNWQDQITKPIEFVFGGSVKVVEDPQLPIFNFTWIRGKIMSKFSIDARELERFFDNRPSMERAYHLFAQTLIGREVSQLFDPKLNLQGKRFVVDMLHNLIRAIYEEYR